MCLVLFAYQPDSEIPLIVAANRDEFYARPASGAHYWEDAPHLLAGRDLSAGGTWLGISSNRRFATVTNFAEDTPGEDAAKSRGELVGTFLQTRESAHGFAHHIDGPAYRGFNLLLWDGEALVYTSNRGATHDLAPGVYGLANAELGARWPKVVRGVAELGQIAPHRIDTAALLGLLADEALPPDAALPHRGRPIELERRVAPTFIRGQEYGTRASTAVIVRRNGCRFAEQSFAANGVSGPLASFDIEFQTSPAPA
jgi:uncharacterized protein with NRDE domain